MKRTIIEIAVTAFVLIAVAGFGVVRYVHGIESAQQSREALLSQQIKDQQKQIDETRFAVDLLVNANKAVGEQLKEETAKRLAAESARLAEIARSQEQISALQKNIEQNKSVDLSAIISSWRPRVASIQCQWVFANGTVAQGSGSGVLFSDSSGSAKIITNGHVVNYQNFTPLKCNIKFPDDSTSYIVLGTSIVLAQNGIDAAEILINNPSQYIRSLASASAARCVSKPAVGDSIVILGYPNIGSANDITATEGIVSGFDGSYFITSAKVERGNSGGAAIHSKNNCYLGIPSFVDLGQIESLARILDQRVLAW